MYKREGRGGGGGGWGGGRGAVNSLTVVVTFHLENVCQRCTLVGGSNKVKDKVSKTKKAHKKHQKATYPHPRTHACTRAHTHARTRTHLHTHTYTHTYTHKTNSFSFNFVLTAVHKCRSAWQFILICSSLKRKAWKM